MLRQSIFVVSTDSITAWSERYVHSRWAVALRRSRNDQHEVMVCIGTYSKKNVKETVPAITKFRTVWKNLRTQYPTHRIYLATTTSIAMSRWYTTEHWLVTTTPTQSQCNEQDSTHTHTNTQLLVHSCCPNAWSGSNTLIVNISNCERSSLNID